MHTVQLICNPVPNFSLLLLQITCLQMRGTTIYRPAERCVCTCSQEISCASLLRTCLQGALYMAILYTQQFL